MNNCLGYCVLVDARISASEKDLPSLKGFFDGKHSVVCQQFGI